MLKKLILPWLCLLGLPVLANGPAQVINVDSQIESVTIFARGAQITRAKNITLDKGRYELKFNNLSPYLSENTIQFKADPSVEILSVKLNTEQNVVDPAKEKEVAALVEKIKAVELDLQISAAEQVVLNSQIKFLTDNSSIGGKNTELSLTNLKQTADYYLASMRDLRMKLIDNGAKITELNSKKEALKEELNKIEENLDREMSQIVVTIEKKQSSGGRVELSYYSPMASWLPQYDIRANDTSSPIELVYKARITQQTLEDWKNVQLTLSNSNPNISGVAPKLEPWYRNAYKIQPQTKSYSSASYEKVSEMQMDEEVAVMAYGTVKTKDLTGAISTSEPRVIANENGTSVEFVIRTPYSIPSSSEATTVDINRNELPATFNYVAAPSVRSDVFLVANLTDWGKLNLLSGAANIYFSNTFVGATAINMSELSDTLTLSLGIDPQVIVERRSIDQFNAKRSVGAKQEQSYGWAISTRNTKQNAIKITLMDQIPLSASSDLEILVDNLSNGLLNSQTGLVRWELEVPSNATQEVELRYRLRYPKNFVIY